MLPAIAEPAVCTSYEVTVADRARSEAEATHVRTEEERAQKSEQLSKADG